ncbi:Fc.00g064420.m01.CDS01 [Cosmosporella sp. VM-42]
MPPFQPFAAVWSQGSRCDQLLKTPEPLAEGDTQPPNAPRPRFRIKRRNVSNLNAPTEQFLASVAAADEPIPSIEEPRVLDQEMVDTMSQFSDMDDISYAGDVPERMFSPPKTPAPGAVHALSPKQYPNWSLESTVSSLESSPEYESSRPSTAHSTHTSASFFSTFSISSEDLSQCVSPETLQDGRFPDLLYAEDADRTIRAQPNTTLRRKSRKGPWTKPMSQHLWSTYMVYLQDPKVTPFRLSKGGIPPPGVCSRVAREAKRSWKGSKPQTTDNASDSLTPTGQSSATFVQWPHSHATTRAHLLELCRLNARTAVRNHQYLAHSPTPFGKHDTRLYNRFSGQDMAMSLAVSTSESMQPHGPLAQLTSSLPEPQVVDELPPPRDNDFTSGPGLEPLESDRTQLASPFVARSYGPSSSSSVPSSFAPPSELQRRQVHTDGPRRLRSPFRLTEGRSTQKRRSGQPPIEPRRTKRPSLGSDLWIAPSTNNRPSASLDLPGFKSSSLEERGTAFAPRTNIQELFEAPQPETPKKPRAPPMDDPPRLGSPFAINGSSLSFPNRLYNAPGVDIGTVRRPFATVQQSGSSSTPSRSSLVSRLAYLDERLREFRRRDHPRRRSESPL